MAISKLSKSTVVNGLNKYDNFNAVEYNTIPYTEGLVMWYDASDASTITQSGGFVSQWNDKSGNNRHAAQASGGNMPSYVTNALNGKPVIDFGLLDSGQRRLIISNNPYQFSTKSVHAFAVGKTRHAGNVDGSAFFGTYTGATTTPGALSYCFPGNGGTDGQQGFLNPQLAWFPPGTRNDYSTSQFYQINGSWDGVSVNYRQSRTGDGGGTFDGTSGSQKISNVTNAIGWQEGSSSGGSIVIAELIVYDKPLSASDIGKVESYLFSKWGV